MRVLERPTVAANERRYHHPNWTSRRPPSRPTRRLVRSPLSHRNWTNFSGPVNGYDTLGRLTSATDGAGHLVGYAYDLDGDLTSLTYPNGHTVTRGFDDADRLASVTDWNTNTTSFGYDADGNLTSTTSPNGVVEATTLNAADQVTAMTDALNTTTLASYSYGRDNNGQLTSTTPTGATGQGNETYGYSALNQLTTDNTATNGAYSYDHADNLIGLPTGATQAFDDANQLSSVTNGSLTTTYGYDSRSNRTSTTTSSDTTTYAYDQANRLTSATSQTDGTLGSYTYDGDGLRTSKTTTSGTLSYSWDHTSSLPLLLSDSTNNYIYGPGGLLVEQLDSSGTPAYVQHDQQGSTRVLTDAAGNVVGTYTYDPYGNTTSKTGAASTPLRYAGQYQDDETGLYYLRARYYDPATAQFLTRDPLESITRSPYGYVDGDPLDGSDPTGLDHCIPFTNICVGFHPGTIPNSIVNIGRGMSFGLSDKIANWISPGASCTVAQNSAQQLVGNAATIVATLGWGSAADAAGAAPDLENLSPKILRQMESRGWTQDQIQEAYDSGERVNAINKANGNAATRYINPTTGQSVVVDNVTGEVIHVGGPGFLYGPGSGDLP